MFQTMVHRNKYVSLDVIAFTFTVVSDMWRFFSLYCEHIHSSSSRTLCGRYLRNKKLFDLSVWRSIRTIDSVWIFFQNLYQINSHSYLKNDFYTIYAGTIWLFSSCRKEKFSIFYYWVELGECIISSLFIFL